MIETATLEMARSMTAQNQYQGDWPRVLCVCSAGLLRSPTLAWVLSNPPYLCNTRAAGSTPAYALIPVDQVLLSWARTVVFVNPENHEEVLARRPRLELPKNIFVLNVPDKFAYRDSGLIEAIHGELVRAGFPERD